MFTTDQIIQNLALSYVAGSGKKISDATSLQIYEYTLESFKRSKLLNGNFKIVWGPAVLKVNDDPTGGQRKDDHVIYMAKNIKNQDDYRIAIRGTESTVNIIEALDIDQIQWNTIESDAPSGLMISEGAGVAMKTIINGKSNNTPGIDSTLFDFITALDSESGNGFDVTVTGHSLGGCLASTLALFLKSLLVRLEPLEPHRKNIRIHSCTFAAPTAGSKSFTDYSAKIFNADGKNKEIYPSNFLRVYNTSDIVPCAWVSEELERFRNLYDGVTPIPLNWKHILDSFVSVLAEVPDDNKYNQPEPSLVFTYPLSKAVSGWVDQIGYQHGSSYPGYYNLTSLDVNMGSSEEGDIIVVVE
ncbi:lipase family protein [Pantoea agglomerans]|uniref:lipase family protein n=1 Tax=Enterobacter agglomerans TaxID=549 RepID=UPI0024132A6F|nr:hypothetical protein [Pantoea agglomerans]